MPFTPKDILERVGEEKILSIFPDYAGKMRFAFSEQRNQFLPPCRGKAKPFT
jgi:hypothetical protein